MGCNIRDQNLQQALEDIRGYAMEIEQYHPM